MTSVVLVHGGWHGEWCWDRVRDHLGRSVDTYAPSLKGLAERSSELSAEVDLDTHIEQIVELLRSNDLRDVVLVGHSYGGAVITGVADREHERLAAIIYLDAFMPTNGDTVLGLIAGRPDDGGDTLPIPPAETFGLVGADARWVQERMTVHPARSVRQVVELSSAVPADNVATKLYVWASGWRGIPHFEQRFRALSSAPGWRTQEIAGSHDLMVDCPRQVADLIRGCTSS